MGSPRFYNEQARYAYDQKRQTAQAQPIPPGIYRVIRMDTGGEMGRGDDIVMLAHYSGLKCSDVRDAICSGGTARAWAFEVRFEKI